MSPSWTGPTVADRRQPWIGLTPYSEAESKLFFGREAEVFELLRLVRREVLTVLFGPSGTGKTSLLNAGLFPRLRECSFLPIAIRLDHSSDSPDYAGQVRTFIAGALRAATTHPIEEEPLVPRQEDQETIWEYSHRVVFWDWRNNPVTLVLAFDQFEEIFTLGQNRAAVEKFLTELADLVENYIPAAVRLRMETRGWTIPFALDQPKCKVVLSLREDFVWRLDSLRKRMPSVMHNRLAISRMNGEQALLAVKKPGQDIVEDPVAQQIVRFVAAANHARTAVQGEDIIFDRFQVDPALLSVVCHELNALRIEQNKSHITEDLVEQAGKDILSDFYERSFAGLKPSVREFMEDRLLTASGFRSTVPLEEATLAGIATADIQILVDRRLTRVEERLGIPHLELTHDLLTTVVQKSRKERQERKLRERERQQREIEQRERQDREERQQAKLKEEAMAAEAKRLRRGLVTVVITLAVAIVALLYALDQKHEALKSAEKAQKAEQEAEQNAKVVQHSLEVTQAAEKRAEEAYNISEKARREALLTASRERSEQFASLRAQRAKVRPTGTPPVDSLPSENPFRPPIKHVIVLMMENRSFDHMLGSLKKIDPRVDGLTGDESNPDSTGAIVKVQPLADFQGQLEHDPGHHFSAVDLQIFGGNTSPERTASMQGFVKSYAQQGVSASRSHAIMYYFSQDKLPVLATLAMEFAVCDRWFSSVPGPTIPNRAFAHYGTSFGHVNMDLFYTRMAYKSIYERMVEGGRTAKIYFYDQVSSTMEIVNLLQHQPELAGTFQQFLNDAKNGSLPEYSFIEPNYSDHDSDAGLVLASDEHPDHNVQAGELFIGSVYNAIRNNEVVWQSSILLITYSNHGGIYDHVPPPNATPDGFVAQPNQTGTEKAFTFDRLGVRVPAVIISPWIPRGTIDHTVYDHASIPATVSKLFLSGPQRISPRERSAQTFDRVLTLHVPRRYTPSFDLD